MKCATLRTACTVLLLICAATELRADYKSSFKRGMQAYNRKEWAGAAELFRAAIAEQAADTGERIDISGLDIQPYLPQFYLGVVLRHLNDCTGALDAWRRSDEQILRRTGKIGDLTRLRGECEVLARRAAPAPRIPPASTVAAAPSNAPAARPAAPAPAPPAPTSTAGTGGAPTTATAPAPQTAPAGTVANAAPAGTIVAGTPRPIGDPPAPVVNPVDREGVALALSRARDMLRQAKEADTSVATLEVDVRKLRPSVWLEPELGPAQQIARRTVESAESNLNNGIARSDLRLLDQARNQSAIALSQYSAIQFRARARQADVQKEFLAVKEVASAVETRPTTPKALAEALPPPSPRANATALSNARAGGGRPPNELLTAAKSFFEGNYWEARRQLSTANFTDAKAVVQAHLLRAASSYALYLMHGEREQALLDEATKEVSLCREGDPQLQPDARTFSPRFRQFFSTTANTPARGKGAAASK
jgi:hypothetical protein